MTKPSSGQESNPFSELWDEAMEEVRARQAYHTRPSREWFARLPRINRWLLGSGSVSALTGLFLLVGLPALGYVQGVAGSVIHPFTANGKRETCLSNLQRVSAALAQYRQDHDDRFPVAEYKASQERRTWMAQMAAYTGDRAMFTCPVFKGQSEGLTTGSYGLNPVMAARKSEHITEPGQVVLLADRGSLHDSMLLPPFAGWPENAQLASPTAGNIDDRHYGESGQQQAAFLYADGHAASEVRNTTIRKAAAWGGDRMFAMALDRIEAQNLVLRQAGAKSPQSFRKHKAKLQQLVKQLQVLQGQCRSSGNACEDVDKQAWRAAGILKALGDGNAERQLTGELHKHAQDILTEAGGEWQRHESELGYVVMHPGSWRVEHQVNGRYRNTFFRSPSPHILLQVERGERIQPSTATSINWTGMEQALKQRYGGNYKRIEMGWDTFGNHLVSVWEYEIKKPDGPKLRKCYWGYSTTWSSMIVIATTPTGEWKEWSSVWQKVKEGFEI